MRFRFVSFLNSIIVLLVSAGCYSGYMPVTKEANEPFNGRADRAIRNRNCIVALGLIDDEKDTTKFVVGFSFHPEHRATPKILGVRLDLKNVSDQRKKFTLFAVRTRQGVLRIKDSRYRSIFDTSSKEFIPITLLPDDGGVDYFNHASYTFFDATLKDYPHKIQAKFEVDTEENGMVETVKDSVVFKRFHALHLTH